MFNDFTIIFRVLGMLLAFTQGKKKTHTHLMEITRMYIFFYQNFRNVLHSLICKELFFPIFTQKKAIMFFTVTQRENRTFLSLYRF